MLARSSALPFKRAGIIVRLSGELRFLFAHSVRRFERGHAWHRITTSALDAGTSQAALVTLRARRLGGWLRIVIENDGHGIDTTRLRQLAVARGMMTRDQANRSQEGDLLPLLFLPGLTTTPRADLLRGRGLGLDWWKMWCAAWVGPPTCGVARAAASWRA